MKTMLSKVKKVVIGSLLLSFSSIFSACPCPDDCCNYRCKAGYPVDQTCMTSGYNAQGRIDVCRSRDYFASATFLYWQPKEQGLDIALISPIYDPTANVAHNLNTHFDYQPGFRVSLGLFLPCDNWGLFADYTYFHAKNNAERKKADTSKIFLTNYWKIGANVNNQSLSSHSTIDQDFIDLSLGRPYYIGTMLIFNPFIGLRGGIVDQRMEVVAQTSTSTYYKTYIKSDSWLIGPRIGIETNWLLADGFRCFGEAFSSVFYQDFKVRAKEFTGKSSSTLTTDLSDNFKYINGSLDLSLGFGWGKYFYCQRLHIDVMAGYEIELLWNQNLMRTFVEEIKNNVHSKPGNLSPHGFIFAMRLDF